LLKRSEYHCYVNCRYFLSYVADPWSSVEVTAEIVSSLKRPELVVIDGSGHLPNLEAEAQFKEALLTFLNQHVP